jgi:hypothetical protein
MPCKVPLDIRNTPKPILAHLADNNVEIPAIHE